MSQDQPRRPQEQPVKYGDVFPVSGDLANKPIAPQDASMMQTAEATALGKTQKGRAAASMQSAATRNEAAGFVSHDDTTDVAGDEGVSVTEVDVPGRRIVTETVAGQVVEQYVKPMPESREAVAAAPALSGALPAGAITIGEALEASAQTAGNKPLDYSDASAIQAAEVRATGSTITAVDGVAATAQAAASLNEQMQLGEGKVTLKEVLTDATTKLAVDKAATREDAEGVVSAEVRNKVGYGTYPGGVADSVVAAAKLNEGI